MINYYTVLGVPDFATYDNIKIAYRKLSKQWHPDLNGGSAYHAEKFKEIHAAYECLSKPDKREFYDYKLTSFLNGNKAKETADLHYTYTAYPQPVYEKERTSNWFTPRTFFRIVWIAFFVFRMYTCNSINSSDEFYQLNHYNLVPSVTYQHKKTAQEILDSFAKTKHSFDSLTTGSNSMNGVEQQSEQAGTR